MALTDVRPATLRRVVDYLTEELGLEISGVGMDLDTGQVFAGNAFYDADEIIKMRKFYMDGGEAWEDGHA